MDTTDKDAILASYSTLGALLTMTTTAIESGQQASWNAITVSGSNILVVGYAQTSSGPQYIAMGEYNTGGTLVSTFGTNGIVQTDAGGSSVGSAILVASNSIWVAGNADMTAVLVQYSPSGAFDQIVRSTIRENATWNAMALAGSNILVAGYCNDGSMAIALSEYNVYGNLVSSFGAGGVVMTKVGTNATANAVMVETSGKILVTGTAQENYLHSDGSGYYQVELALVQYQSNGALDPTFGSDGVALPFVTSGATSDGYALATLSNGNVALAGQIEDSSSGHDIFVTEYSVATTPSSVYTYDVRNKMVGFSGATGTATYVYDDSGNRVQEKTGGTTSFYLTDTANPTGYAQPIEVWTSTNGSLSGATLNTTYLIGDRVFGQDVSGTLSYLSVDGQDNTRLLTSGTGAVSAVFNYDAFGDALNFNLATASTVVLFQQTYYDAASGLNLYGDATRGVEPGKDSYIEMDGQSFANSSDPLSLSLLLLDNADPLSNWDPSGHAPDPSDFGLDIDSMAAAYNSVLQLNLNYIGAVASNNNLLVDSIGQQLAVVQDLINTGRYPAAAAVGGTILQLQNFANQAANQATQALGATSGNAFGIVAHGFFEDQVIASGNPLLQAEVSYTGGRPAVYRGQKNSVRLDAVLYRPNGTIKAIFDLKTGTAKLDDDQEAKIERNIPMRDRPAPIIVIRPQ
jgi:uncharacterized delta-60 repeat protein